MLTQTQWRKYNMFKLLVASNNQNKIKEYKDIFKGYDVKIYSLKDFNIAIDPIENGKTYYENALIKANACKPFSLIPTISDDSGIEIDGLGEHYPGVFSHRYAQQNGGQENTNKFLIKDYLGNKAVFHCSIVLINLPNTPVEFVGEVHGTISEIKQDGGFGYDPVFKMDSTGKTYSELTPEEKDKMSHRYLASIKLLEYLKSKKYI